MQTLKEFTRELDINGVKTIALIRISYDYETDAPDFDCGNEEDNEHEARRFQSGELLNLVIQVKACAEGESAWDTLGQVFVRARQLEYDLEQTCAEHEMTENVLFQLKSEIINKAQRLQKYIA